MAIDKQLLDNYAGVFDGTLGLGRRPAVLVIDFIRAYTTEGSPLYAAQVVEAVRSTAPLLAKARALESRIIGRERITEFPHIVMK